MSLSRFSRPVSQSFNPGAALRRYLSPIPLPEVRR